MAKPSRNERSRIRRFEAMLKEERIIAEDEFVTHVMEADSFNDTIKEVEAVVDLGCLHYQRMIAVNSIDMYAAIDHYRQGILMESTTVNEHFEECLNNIGKPLRFLCRRSGVLIQGQLNQW